MIKFVSLSNNDDPMTREGLLRPEQQMLLCELLVMERLMDNTEELISQMKLLQDVRPTPAILRMITKLAKLRQRLLRLVLRKNAKTCKYAADKKDRNGQSAFVVPLGEMMGYGILAAESLREIYVDNADLLDEVTSDTVEPILELIRTQGRKGRYIDFLMVLCECDGKAVRPNQWTISDLIFSPENKPPFLQLELTDGEILINGDEEYFPTFSGRKGEPMKLIEWLVADPPSGADAVRAADHREVRRYFTKTIALYEKLCFGRCEKTTRILRELLSYELVEAVIMSDFSARIGAGEDLR